MLGFWLPLFYCIETTPKMADCATQGERKQTRQTVLSKETTHSTGVVTFSHRSKGMYNKSVYALLGNPDINYMKDIN